MESLQEVFEKVEKSINKELGYENGYPRKFLKEVINNVFIGEFRMNEKDIIEKVLNKIEFHFHLSWSDMDSPFEKNVNTLHSVVMEIILYITLDRKTSTLI